MAVQTTGNIIFYSQEIEVQRIVKISVYKHLVIRLDSFKIYTYTLPIYVSLNILLSNI